MTRHYSLTRGCFGERAIVTYFWSLRTLVFFFYKLRESISRLYQGFFQTDIKFFAKCRVRTIPVDRTCLWWSEKKNCPNQWLK